MKTQTTNVFIFSIIKTDNSQNDLLSMQPYLVRYTDPHETRIVLIKILKGEKRLLSQKRHFRV